MANKSLHSHLFSAPFVLCKGLLKHIIVDVNKMIIVSVRTGMNIYLCC